MFITDIVIKITYFFHQLYTLWFIFCISNKVRKGNLKYLLVTDNISIHTYFRVRTTYNEYQNSNKMIT